MKLSHTFIAVALAASVHAASVAAQCANGSPPPCGQPTAARKDPALDSLAWIVLPFTNTTHAADLDWLSEASIGLLSFDMRRWIDLRVVDKERVVDLLRTVPAPERARLGLQRGIALARQAGARNLVMGEFLRDGARVTVTVSVFDARTEKVTRAVSQRSSADSITALYGRLVPMVLKLPTPVGTTLIGIGTQSTEAVRSYSLGIEALNRSRTDSALRYFSRAIAIDSTFALAHLRLGVLPQSKGAVQARAYAAAARFAKDLPERERMVIALALTSGAALRCDYGRKLVALDSADAEGWYALGQCFRDNQHVVTEGGVTRREVSVNAARKAFERVLELQSHRGAMLDLPNLMRSPTIAGCSAPTLPCPPESKYAGALVLERDTLVARFEQGSAFNLARRREFSAARRAKEMALRDFLARWTAANPQDILAHAQYASVLVALGDLSGMLREFDAAHEMWQLVGDGNRQTFNTFAAEGRWKLGQPARAAAMLDSIPPTIGQFHIAFALFRRDADSSAAARAVSSAFYAAYTGVVHEDFPQTIHAYAAAAKPSDAEGILAYGTTLAFHQLRTRPASDTAAAFALYRFQAFFARGDMANARRALLEYDVWGDDGAETYWDAHEMFSAESHLEMGDTTKAWTRIEPLARRFQGYELNGTTFWPVSGFYIGTAAMLGRAWLLYADLAMATGHTDEAKRGYQMIVGMWEHGDPPVQPLVTRAKVALVKLGGP